MKALRPFVPALVLLTAMVCGVLWGSVCHGEGAFQDIDGKKAFAREISSRIEMAWKDWQGSLVVDDVEVEGAKGFLCSGKLRGPRLDIMEVQYVPEEGVSRASYSDDLRLAAKAIEEGVASWQRGYSHMDIPFPQGASCVFTLTPCDNVPVSVNSGSSSGDRKMTEDALYTYMLYRTPRTDDGTLKVLKGVARAVSIGFEKWKKASYLVGITASGGIAPSPAPMGPGPGPVQGARGSGGKISGGVMEAEVLYGYMIDRSDEDK
ncbi:MAG: hypothetical protein PHH49_02390 [Candidatus Omnitrophica bacterium]|nr:hypothetical protein [Candidatus Omnitrophota bacterium]MDD5487796.1 hypothetical protein [Candidatus Omnitrophota bacterium]